MKQKKIEVLAIAPHKKPEVVVIENTLEAMQEFVGGYIETLTFENNIVLVCDDEGKLKGKEPSFEIPGGDIIVGNCFFAGIKRDEFCSLSMRQILALVEQLIIGGSYEY